MRVFADQAHEMLTYGEALNDGRLGDDEANDREWTAKCIQLDEASPEDAADLVMKARVLLLALGEDDKWAGFARDVVRVLGAA